MKTESSPILSIIIPVYNVENYIKECLDSIIAQRIANYEVIIVNDGSTDNSLAITKQYERIPNFHIFTKGNEGLSATRNYGINRATGKYIMFIDSDDFIIPNSLSDLLKDLEQNKTLYVGRYIRHYEEYKKNELCDDALFVKLKNGSNRLNKYIYNTKHFSPSVRYVVKREFIVQNNLKFMVGYLHEDLFWSAQLLDLIEEDDCFFTSAIWYNHRQTNLNSITKNISFENIMDVFNGVLINKPNIKNKHIKEQMTKSVYAKLRYYYQMNDNQKKDIEKFIDNNVNMFNSDKIKYKLFYYLLNVVGSRNALRLSKKLI